MFAAATQAAKTAKGKKVELCMNDIENDTFEDFYNSEELKEFYENASLVEKEDFED